VNRLKSQIDPIAAVRDHVRAAQEGLASLRNEARAHRAQADELDVAADRLSAELRAIIGVVPLAPVDIAATSPGFVRWNGAVEAPAEPRNGFVAQPVVEVDVVETEPCATAAAEIEAAVAGEDEGALDLADDVEDDPELEEFRKEWKADGPELWWTRWQEVIDGDVDLAALADDTERVIAVSMGIGRWLNNQGREITWEKWFAPMARGAAGDEIIKWIGKRLPCGFHSGNANLSPSYTWDLKRGKLSLWIGDHTLCSMPRTAPTIAGDELVAAIRRVFKIPAPAGVAASQKSAPAAADRIDGEIDLRDDEPDDRFEPALKWALNAGSFKWVNISGPLDDDALSRRIAEAFGGELGRTNADLDAAIAGGKRSGPRLWMPASGRGSRKAPALAGAELVAAARRILGIPAPGEKPAKRVEGGKRARKAVAR
jgi:hypothetical protein